MNIAIILAGGSGKRFGANLPKQYLKLNNRPVVDYVIRAAKKSKNTDKIILVMNKEYIKYSEEINADMDIVENGKERHYSLQNALNYIKEHYKDCKKVIILNAVSPMVTPELLDDYFEKLDTYDLVMTCEKVTGEIVNENFDRINRNKLLFAQSPEAYRFDLLYEYLDPESEYTEVAYHLPKNIKYYLNQDFKYNVKITYDFELIYCETLMKYLNRQNNK